MNFFQIPYSISNGINADVRYKGQIWGRAVSGANTDSMVTETDDETGETLLLCNIWSNHRTGFNLVIPLNKSENNRVMEGGPVDADGRMF